MTTKRISKISLSFKNNGIRCHQEAAQAASRSSDIFNLGMMLLKDSQAICPPTVASYGILFTMTRL